ncbi:MAG TPA: gliding motility-associated C-terminal domain-containing protein [Ohtaekwangia sp.]
MPRKASVLKKGPSLVLVMLAFFCHAQTPADCPLEGECAPCEAGMISITLEFRGAVASLVTVEDKKTVIFSGQVSPNGDIVIVPQGRPNFQGNTLEVKVNDVLNTSLNTKCNIPIFVNAVYGDFVVMAGESKQGGPICCAPKPPDPTDPTDPTDPDPTDPEQEFPFVISKVVTPNGDGQNDVWVLLNIEQFSETHVTIVDRWGSTIYEASGYDNRNVAWNGENKNGGKAPTGTYFYSFRGKLTSSVFEKQGSIELIR